MNTANDAFTTIADIVLRPVAQHPGLALILCSIVSGAVMTVVFRHTSNQSALVDASQRTRASLLAMRLFNDDLGVAVRSQAELLRATASRLWHSLPPVLVLALPFLVILPQLALRFEHRPLGVGEAAVVEVRVRQQAWPQWRDAVLTTPAEFAVETPALRDEQERMLLWRVRARAPVTGALRVHADTAEAQKALVAASDTRALECVSAVRPGPSVWSRLLHPGEAAFDANGPIESISVRYPARRPTRVLGIDLPWWAVLLVLSMLTALALRPVLKVQF